MALSLLSACVAYKAETVPDADFVAMTRRLASDGTLQNVLSVAPRINTVPERTICSEPLGTFLTLGIIPRYCSDTFQATVTEVTGEVSMTLTRNYESTFVAGLLALFLLPSADWRYGYREQIGRAIELEILENAK